MIWEKNLRNVQAYVEGPSGQLPKKEGLSFDCQIHGSNRWFLKYLFFRKHSVCVSYFSFVMVGFCFSWGSRRNELKNILQWRHNIHACELTCDRAFHWILSDARLPPTPTLRARFALGWPTWFFTKTSILGCSPKVNQCLFNTSPLPTSCPSQGIRFPGRTSCTFAS